MADPVPSTLLKVFIPGINKNAFLLDPQLMRLGAPVKLLSLADGKLPMPKLPIDWAKALTFPSYGNDIYGDCMLAAAEHADATFTGNHGTESTFDPIVTVAAYLKASGGDNGLNVGTIIDMWSGGLPGVPEAKVMETLGIDTTNQQLVQTAIWLFGGVHFQLNLPDPWLDNFTAGGTWDAPATADKKHGHGVWWNGVDNHGNYHVQTWGTDCWITPAGVKVCQPSGFVVFSARWFNADGMAPNGLSYNQLAAYWQQMGGRQLPVWPAKPTTPGRLLPGQGLLLNQSIQSPDGRFHLSLQTDGNLVLRGPGSQPMWASGTDGDHNVWSAIMQADGNFVVYNGDTKHVWASGTDGKPGATLLLQNDGNLVVYETNNHAAWASNTVVRLQPAAPNQPGRLLPGQGLIPNQSIQSPDGRLRLAFQGDGNLVLYGPANQPLWASNTDGHTHVWDAIMQGDGNFVIYDEGNKALWASGTAGKPGASLTLENGGNMVITDTANHVVWATNTNAPAAPAVPSQIGRMLPGEGLLAGHSLKSPNGRFELDMQADGNLVLYGPGRDVFWASGTNGHTTVWYVVMQTDGNLVIYDIHNKPFWASNTAGNAGVQLVLGDNGNLAVVNGANHTFWATNTFAPGTPATPNFPDKLLPGQGLLPGMSISSGGGDKLILQSDGNLVLYDKYNQAKWSSKTSGHSNVWDAVMQTDGNFVLYDIHNHAIWASNTAGKNGASLSVQGDGNTVIYDTGNHAVWATGTNRHG